MTIRAAGKLVWFAWHVVVDILDYLCTTALVREKKRRPARAAWLSRSARRHIQIFGYTVDIAGEIPTSGLLVSNHLSYLDILAICSAAPSVFVSKADVKRWPVFGLLATLGGTVFIERERRTHVGEGCDARRRQHGDESEPRDGEAQHRERRAALHGSTSTGALGSSPNISGA